MNLLAILFVTASLAVLVAGIGYRAPCISGATFNPETDRCECPPGQIGDGQLCCVDEAKDLCVIRGDPILTSVANVTRKLHYPCTHQVSKVTNLYGDQDFECNLEVFTSSQFGGYGSLMPDAVGIRISARRFSLFFVLRETSFVNPVTKMEEHMSPAKKERIFSLDNLEVRFSLDFSARIWRFSFCGGEVIFRSGRDFLPQPKQEIPGVCVSSKRASFRGLPMDGNVCNIFRDYSPAPFDSPSLRLMSDMINNFDNLEESEKIDSQGYQGHCAALTSSYKACGSTERKVQAMNACNYIITSQIRRRCISARRLDLFGVFTDCMSSFCTGDRAACDRLKNSDRDSVYLCYDKALECESWVENTV